MELKVLLHIGKLLLYYYAFLLILLFTYSAPEVRAPYNFTPRAQRVSSKADIYSLGVILYGMTYGVWPDIPETDP